MFSAIVPYVKLSIMFVARWSSRLTRWKLRKFVHIWYVLPLRACWRACGGARCWKANSKRRVGKRPVAKAGEDEWRRKAETSGTRRIVTGVGGRQRRERRRIRHNRRHQVSFLVPFSLTFASLSPQIALWLHGLVLKIASTSLMNNLQTYTQVHIPPLKLYRQ